MGDTSSQVRVTQPETAPVNEELLPHDMPTSPHVGSPVPTEVPATPLRTDPPTVISGQAPILPPSASDSACRILEGRVMPGDRMGHFDLVEYVGGGGMGRVFRAIDTRLARTVALKVLSPEQAADPDALQRFQNEAQSAARLDHDNIVRVYFVGEDRGLHFIVFEFIEGVNVRVLVERKGPLPVAEAISYTLQSAEALAHSDAHGVVHRDIKPSNLLITPEGRVKLIDMGLARLRMVESEAADLTASGVTLGTFDYISPEQARDPRNADIRSDIYSLGCTFFFMLTGRPPFPDGTVLQKLLQHQGDQPPDIRQSRPDLPEEAGRILRKMMAKDPRHRYASPVELVGDLLTLAEHIGLRPMSPTSKVWLTPQEPRVPFLARHLPWIAPIAALVCIVVVLDLFWSLSASREEAIQGLATAGSDESSSSAKRLDSRSVERTRGASTETPSPPRKLPDDARSAASESGLVADGPAPPSYPKGLADVGTPGTGISKTAVWNESPAKIEPKAEGLGRESETLSNLRKQPVLVTNETPSDRADIASRDRAATANNGPTMVASPAKSSPVENPAASPRPVASTAAPSPGSTAGAAAPPNVPPSNVPPPVSESRSSGDAKVPGLLVVSQRGDGEGEYATLAAALAVARDGDVVELRYDGQRQERPMKMSNLRITVRAGRGYRPAVVFRPTETDPVKCPRSMITLTSGRLTVADVALELDVPRHVAADNWAMFETRGGQTVRLERCVFSIRNASDQLTAYHPDVAFFRTIPIPQAEGGFTGVQAATPLTTLELADCIARGEATFLRVDDLQPVHLLWDNGLLVTTERLLAASGGDNAPRPDEMLRLELQHVTGVVRSGLCRLTSSPSNPHQLTVQLGCSDCIWQGTPGMPFIEQEGEASPERFREHIVWNGERNCYEDIDVFWAIRSLDPDTPAETFHFDAWTRHWGPSRESQSSTERLDWVAIPSPNRALHTHGPSDYTLSSGASAGGEEEIGAVVKKLPQAPAEPAETKQTNDRRTHRNAFDG
jgi:serine/threonine-protein kinase